MLTMHEEIKKIQVTHVNIRLSISFLVLRLLGIELIAALAIILLHSFIFSPYSTLVNVQVRELNIPLFLALVLIKTSLTIFVVFQWLNEYYEISAEFIIHKKGAIFRREEKFPTAHVANVDITQNLLGKILNYGTIILYNYRRQVYTIMYQIHNPIRYSKILEDLIPNLEEEKNIVYDQSGEREDEEITK